MKAPLLLFHLVMALASETSMPLNRRSEQLGQYSARCRPELQAYSSAAFCGASLRPFYLQRPTHHPAATPSATARQTALRPGARKGYLHDHEQEYGQGRARRLLRVECWVLGVGMESDGNGGCESRSGELVNFAMHAQGEAASKREAADLL